MYLATSQVPGTASAPLILTALPSAAQVSFVSKFNSRRTVSGRSVGAGLRGSTNALKPASEQANSAPDMDHGTYYIGNVGTSDSVKEVEHWVALRLKNGLSGGQNQLSSCGFSPHATRSSCSALLGSGVSRRQTPPFLPSHERRAEYTSVPGPTPRMNIPRWGSSLAHRQRTERRSIRDWRSSAHRSGGWSQAGHVEGPSPATDGRRRAVMDGFMACPATGSACGGSGT